MLQEHNGGPYPYTAQNCKYFRPVPIFFVYSTYVCGGSALADIISAKQQFHNPMYLP